MKTESESPQDRFNRIVSTEIDRTAFDCVDESTPFQIVCLSYIKSEQAWLGKLLQTRHVRQPGIIYGIYEARLDETQAYAIEKVDEIPAFIAVSSYFVYSLGTFFRAALARREILGDFGNPQLECTSEELGPGLHEDLRPRDPERQQILKLLIMMAMRFLTAHEMTHILNGHLRYRLSVSAGTPIAEAQHRVERKDALLSQTLEMDADAGAVAACMPGVILAERAPEEVHRIGCHSVYQKPEAALRLWLFAVYAIFRMLEDRAQPVQLNESSHPPPMIRIQLIFGTLRERYVNRILSHDGG
jgi:hypothetical protein